ncbi:MAG TPA: malic enzyme-like NAD(P)-binding protein [Dissulfurispiraceae bacterium]|nr:malic enzyme-like NAD(P)-binding protein [Dissulfurispiraceae bacterium]
MALYTKEEALTYHSTFPYGKLEVIPIKPCTTQKHLSMAYSPGVAETCRAIAADPADVYKYTNKGNLVAVVSNGTAILGLGNLGPLAAKPVMEGKGVLFKTFADIDVYDINLDAKDPDLVITVCKALEPTFGGINLEDIKAPECFYIEEKLKKEMNIPVFHDDQHGTAIISGAGLLNALEISGKKVEDLRVVVSGAGAAGIACCKFYVSLGVQPENIAMFDSKGHVNAERKDLNEQKRYFATKKKYDSLADAFKGADMFLGLSQANLVSPEMVKSMNKNPIIFAMANPDPEIPFNDAKAARSDLMMGTGRSDFPNQVNNVSGFPYIFRGALDVRATSINEEMKLAAAKSLAALAKEPVPREICDAYGVKELSFGIDYVIPKALDTRMLVWEAPAVAKAAMETGVAQVQIDLEQYKKQLRDRLDNSQRRIGEFVKSYKFNF